MPAQRISSARRSFARRSACLRSSRALRSAALSGLPGCGGAGIAGFAGSSLMNGPAKIRRSRAALDSIRPRRGSLPLAAFPSPMSAARVPGWRLVPPNADRLPAGLATVAVTAAGRTVPTAPCRRARGEAPLVDMESWGRPRQPLPREGERPHEARIPRRGAQFSPSPFTGEGAGGWGPLPPFRRFPHISPLRPARAYARGRLAGE